MRYQLLVLAALSLEGVIAQPAHHRHHHKLRRNWQDVDFKAKTDYNMEGVDFAKAYAEGQKGAGAAAPADSSAPAENAAPAHVEHSKEAVGKKPKVIDVIPVPAESDKKEDDKESKHNDSDSKSSEVKSSDKSSGSNGGDITGGAKGSFGGKRAGFMGGPQPDQYHGNVGVPYGSNMMAINTGDIDKYKYTNTFKNTGSNPLPIIIWNKEGRDGVVQSGMGQDPVMRFTVQPGQSQAVAFDENTLAAFSRDCTRDPLAGNLPQCVWGEVSFGDEMPAVGTYQASGKHSGFDRSSIHAGADEILTMTCISCDDKARKETKSGKGQNTWETAADPFHSNGIAPGPAHLLTEMAI